MTIDYSSQIIDSDSNSISNKELNEEIIEIITELKNIYPNASLNQLYSLVKSEIRKISIDHIKNFEPWTIIHKKKMEFLFKRSTSKRKEKIEKNFEYQQRMNELSSVKHFLVQRDYKMKFHYNLGDDYPENFRSKKIISDNPVSEENDNSFSENSSILNQLPISKENRRQLKKRSYDCNLDLNKLQDEMLTMGSISAPLTVKEIEKILNNPFIKYRFLAPAEDLSEIEHEDFKKKFTNRMEINE